MSTPGDGFGAYGGGDDPHGWLLDDYNKQQILKKHRYLTGLGGSYSPEIMVNSAGQRPVSRPATGIAPVGPGRPRYVFDPVTGVMKPTIFAGPLNGGPGFAGSLASGANTKPGGSQALIDEIYRRRLRDEIEAGAGVRPGKMPEMNPVEAARARGIGGSQVPSGPPVTDPRKSALAPYPYS